MKKSGYEGRTGDEGIKRKQFYEKVGMCIREMERNEGYRVEKVVITRMKKMSRYNQKYEAMHIMDARMF